MVSSGLLWWREKGLTLHGEASTLHHELHLMLFNCVITWEISGVLLGKRQALQSVPQMFQGNNQKMKFIWLLKPLWQLPFHFSNLLCCLLPLPPVLHEIFAWKQNWGFHFSPCFSQINYTKPRALASPSGSVHSVLQSIIPQPPLLISHLVAVENIIRGKVDLRKQTFPISSARCQLLSATVQWAQTSPTKWECSKIPVSYFLKLFLQQTSRLWMFKKEKKGQTWSNQHQPLFL